MYKSLHFIKNYMSETKKKKFENKDTCLAFLDF